MSARPRRLPALVAVLALAAGGGAALAAPASARSGPSSTGWSTGSSTGWSTGTRAAAVTCSLTAAQQTAARDRAAALRAALRVRPAPARLAGPDVVAHRDRAVPAVRQVRGAALTGTRRAAAVAELVSLQRRLWACAG